MREQSRFSDITPAILIPIIFTMCLMCGVSVVGVAVLSGGSGPFESIYLQVYIRLNDDQLHSTIGNDATPRRFEVLPGSTANDIGIQLVTEGFISNGTLFARYAQYKDLDDDLVPGVFYINETMDIPAILEALTDPTPTTVRFTIRENMRIEEIADQIDATTPALAFTGDEFLSRVRTGAPIPDDFRIEYGIPSGSSLEGFMYPATYDVPLEMPVDEFVDMLLTRFEQAITSEVVVAAAAQGRTVYQVLIIASIVEREAVLDDERPIIASVYWNRVNNGMRLDADPTVQYQLANNRADGIWWPAITQADYSTATGPYNTYLNVGLPPTPIVSPAYRSIIAAANPTPTNYLYFQVSCEGGGQHVFFSTFEEQQAYLNIRLAGCQ